MSDKGGTMNLNTHDSDMLAMRHAMVASQLRTNAVSDPRVVAAMDSVPREAFLPSEVAALAYRDTAVPLGHGRAQNVPIATGRLLTQAELLPTDRVLLIGAAGGYTAAVLAELVASVVAVECDPALAAHARAALAGTANITLVEGPLENGHAAGAPYDVLVIDGAVEGVSDALVEQVAIGGRAVAGIIDRGVTRLAAGRRSAGGFGLLAFADIECVPLPGFAQPRTFTF
ncbi:protein-L-isoaspartate O-methyltransferase [Sphingomonas sp. TF3]|nr:protein-L-isoaspartate O-methyltransferase [Sphingomonas sp. TF3]